MKLRLEFGAPAKRIREVDYNGSHVSNFPKIVRYDGAVWEFIAWDTDKMSGCDFKLLFGERRNYDEQNNLPVTDLEGMFGSYDISFGNKCECGATYQRGFENFHSRWCPKWEKL